MEGQPGQADSNEATVPITVNFVNDPPAVPQNLSVTAGAATVSLDWDDNTEAGLAGYNVYCSMTKGGPYTRLNGTLVADSSYTDTTAVNDTTYYYVVTAVDQAQTEMRRRSSRPS